MRQHGEMVTGGGGNWWDHGGTPRSSLHPVPVSLSQCWPAARRVISTTVLQYSVVSPLLSLSSQSPHSPR